MTLPEVIQIYLLPILGVLGGLTGLITFVFSHRQRKAEAIRIEADAKEIMELTPTKVTQMIVEASAKALEGQNGVNTALQKRLTVVTDRMTKLECRLEAKAIVIEDLKDKVDRLEKELGIREANIVALEEKLTRYEAENEQYREENLKLKKQIDAQQKRIKELEHQLAIIQAELKERGCE